MSSEVICENDGIEKILQEEEDTEESQVVEDLPEMMDLVDEVEEAAQDPSALAQVLRRVGGRAKLSLNDREAFCDFEGVSKVCEAISKEPHNWRGEAMLALCAIIPELCRASVINRGAFNDEGFVDQVVDYLDEVVRDGNEEEVMCMSTALSALCTAHDGNKKAAARLLGEFNEEELVKSDCNDPRVPLFKESEKPGALNIFLNALTRFQENARLQAAVLEAFTCLIRDDDARQASVPWAVKNRDQAVGTLLPEVLACAHQAIALACKQSFLKLRQQILLLVKEIACRQDTIETLLTDASLLPCMQSWLGDKSLVLVRASLSALRALAFADSVKEAFVFESDIAKLCLLAVQIHLTDSAVCAQGFGFFANIALRKPHIAAWLEGSECSVVGLAHHVMEKHVGQPAVMSSVIQALRNIMAHNKEKALEIVEPGMFDNLRQVVVKHQNEPKWRSATQNARQLLLEFDELGSLRASPEWNEYY